MQGLRAVTLLKRDSNTGAFLWNLRNCKKNYFEEDLQTTVFCSSSFKLDLVDLTVFPNSNLRLAKINKPLTTVCVSKFSRFCSHASSFLRYQAQKLQNSVFFIHFPWIDVKSKRCFGGLSLISIILREYCENNIKTFWYYSYENKLIISWKIVRFFFFFLRSFKAFPLIRLYLFS